MHYLIQVNLYLIVFLGFYALMLRKETFYQANRFYLIISSVISFVIPFIHTSWVQSWFVTQEVSHLMAGSIVSEIPVTPVAGKQGVSPGRIFLGLYIGGVIFFTWRFGLRVYRTLHYVSSFVENEVQAFSFFGKVRVGKSLECYKAVLDHERNHVVQCHSFDVILFEVIGILCWINPFVYYLKREVRLLHEYQADAYASRMAGSKAYYAALLVSQKFGVTPDALLGNPFFTQSFLSARIRMLGKESSGKKAWLKYGLVAPLFSGMMVLASASMARSENLEKIELYSKELVLGNLQTRGVKEVKIDLVRFRENGTVKTVGDHEDMSSGNFRFLPERPTRKEIRPQKAEQVVITAVQMEEFPREEVFVQVETQPVFPGGEQEMYRFLATHLHYPEAAERAQVQGRVTLQFIVEKDGSVHNPKVLKGIGFGADEEAVRVVSSMPKWTPGVQNGRNVRVYYTIPILFTLAE